MANATPRPKRQNRQTGVRLPESTFARVDEWRRRQKDIPPRSEAMRRLLEKSMDQDGIPPGDELLANEPPEKLFL